jgi:hypothetical protein
MATIYNDKIFAQTAFQQLTKILSPLRAFLTDISPALRSEGDAVIVPLFENVATTTFDQTANSGMPYEEGGGEINAITVNLNKRFKTAIDMTLQQLAESSNVARHDQWAIQLGNSAAQRVLTEVWGVLTTTNFGEAIITTSPSNYGRAQLIKARQELLKAGVRGEKTFMVDMEAEAGLLGDDKITLALNRGDAQAIREGELGRLLGMNVMASDIIPLNAISLCGFACGQQGIAFAMRNLGDFLPSENYEAVEQLVDNESGISALYTRHWSTAKGKYFINLHTLFGFSPAVTKAVKLFRKP